MAGDGKGKYGHIMTEKNNFYADEPVFIIRATDKTAVESLVNYAIFAKLDGASNGFIMDVLEFADRMRQWQAEHPDLVKIPD